MKGSGVKLIPVGNTINIFHPSSGDPPCWSGGSPGPGSNVASCRLSGGGPGVSSLSREAQLLSPRSPSGESQDTPRSAGSTVLPACPGSSSGYSSNGGVFRKPDQVASSSELFHLLLLVEEQQLYPETLRASRPVSEGEPRHPVEETYLCRLCLWSHSFLLYPQLVATRSERRWSVKSRLFLFSIAPSIEPRLMHCWLCIDPPVNLPLHSSFIRETGPLNFSTWGKIWSSKQREHSNLCGPLLWIWRYRFHPSCLTRSCKRLCGDPVLSPQPGPPPVCLSLANTEAVFHACYLLHTGATNDTSESSHAEGSRVSPDAFLWYMIIYLQMYGCKWLFICISYPTVHMHQIHSIPAMRLWLF